MMSFRNVFQTLVLIVLLGVLGYVWYQVPVPCQTPLEYSIGQFDPRFHISQDEFLKDVAAAESPWEQALGKDIFHYNPDAPFKLNLIYDGRQQRTVEQQKLEASRQALQEKQTTVQASQSKLVSTYNDKKASYDKDLANFQADLSSYNTEVDYWNKRGGAPPDEYQKLQDEKKKLEKEQADLNDARNAVNALANQINTTSKQSVATVEQYNTQVQNFLQAHSGEPEDFDEGIFDGKEINIYQFDDEAHLRGVLAHELGHWLGLDHVENSASIMYHLMSDQDLAHLTLTTEDKNELQNVCHKSRWDLFREKLNLLRSRLSLGTLLQ